jgi:hypothetical protein
MGGTIMTATLTVLRSPSQPGVEDDQRLSIPELATARYVDREAGNARAAATLCSTVATRAKSQDRMLVAGMLNQLASEFTDEANSLAQATHPEVRWPRRSSERVAAHGSLDEAIDVINGSLQHSERTLRWIARRPDLPRLVAVTFEALASTRRSQRNLLCACRAVDH